MERNQAIELLKSTLNAPYDEYKFSNLAINFLNDLDSSNATGVLLEDYLKPNFKNHILQYKRLGSYTDAEGESIDVLTVQLKNEWALERSRGVLRNFAADYIKNNSQGNAALVAYYTNNLEDWRFSYIRLDYSLEKSDSGKVKVREDLTPAKRYSYLVGLNEPNHTAQEQILPLLESHEKPSIDEIENAFKVDALSKLFYQDYRKLFEDLTKEIIRIMDTEPLIKTEFENNNIQPDNFSKRLMGQIVFLYFIQKKGWLGVKKDSDWGSGEKRYLQKLFKNYSSNNFYIEVLEPLFYEALATDRHGDYYSKLDCKIPFLSGGLFEPMNDFDWINVKVPIKNQLIENIFSKFDQYNFTVRESDPIEVDVAIDPEMLGRVFENLLPENIRKGKGAYYTPRTIVHYMCQESLINYLDTECKDVPKNDLETLIREGDLILELETEILEEKKTYQSFLMESINNNAQSIDDALSNIKVCDPAIGSGAFPVGMLHEIVKARKVLELYLKKEETTYSLKRHCIQESIYGVDIDPGAIDIAKLRLWLSLVVDEEDFKNIQTLPNLDYKIMQGNSLIEEFHGISLDIEKKDKQQKDLFTGGSDLDALIDKLHQRQTDFFNAEHPNDKKKKREAVETAIYNVFHNELEKNKNISSDKAKEIETDLKEMTHGNKVRNFFPWKLYFADVFREKGGFDVVIANPPYSLEISKNEKKLLREYYKTIFFKINLFSCFIELAPSLIKNLGILCFINPSMLFANDSLKLLRKYIVEDLSIYQLINLGDGIFEQVTMPTMITIIKKQINVDNDFVIYRNVKKFPIQVDGILTKQNEILTNYNYVIEIMFEKDRKIIEKISKNSKLLGDVLEINQGIITGNDNKHLSSICENENYKPTIRGKDISKYSTNYPQLFVNYTPKLLACPRTPHLFDCEEKILIRRTADSPIASFDSRPTYNLHTLYSCRPKDKIDIKYLLGIINCKLMKFCYQQKLGAEIGRTFAEIKILYIRQLPIRMPQKQEMLKIRTVVDQILTTKIVNPEADATALEAEIDQLVYKLYGLTDEEIAIVEESVG